MQVFVVMSFGGDWSNDDHAEPGPAGVYSTQQKAEDAIREMMIDESIQFCEANFDKEDEWPQFEEMSYEEVEEFWSEQLETEPYAIFTREMDSNCISVTEVCNEGVE